MFKPGQVQVVKFGIHANHFQTPPAFQDFICICLPNLNISIQYHFTACEFPFFKGCLCLLNDLKSHLMASMVTLILLSL